MGFSVEQIQKALQGKGLQAKDPLFDASEVNKGLMGIRLVKEEQKSLYEFQANAAKEQERIQDAEKRAAELLQQAQREFTLAWPTSLQSTKSIGQNWAFLQRRIGISRRRLEFGSQAEGGKELRKERRGPSQCDQRRV